VKYGLHSVVDTYDEASGALGNWLDPYIEPDRAVERSFLVEHQVHQFVAKDFLVFLGSKIPLFSPPTGDSIDHTKEKGSDTCLSIGRTGMAAEIARNHNIERHSGPEGGGLDAMLLENDVSLLIADYRRTSLPLDHVQRFSVFNREEPAKPQSFTGRLHRGCEGLTQAFSD
jgi:hypothetical protein